MNSERPGADGSNKVPPHDPESALALAALGDWQAPQGLSIVEALRLLDGVPGPDNGQLAGDDYRVVEHHIPSADGTAAIPALVCLPKEAPAALPVMFWIHGGGMVAGTHRTGVAEMLPLAREFGAALVSIGYRPAPENPYPVPVEDCYDGYLWVLSHAAQLGLDRDHIVVCGASAGGGLAAALVLVLRDRSVPPPTGQMLLYPMLDDRNNSPSVTQLAEWATWNRQANEAGWTALLGSTRGAPDVSPHAAPARATDLSELPSTFLEVGSTDLFRDEVINYANQFWLDGGDCELHVWPGGFHGYDTVAPASRISCASRAARRSWIRQHLGGGRAEPA